MEQNTTTEPTADTICEVVRIPATLPNGQDGWRWLVENSGMEDGSDADNGWATSADESLILTITGHDAASFDVVATRDPEFHDSLVDASWPDGTVVEVIG